MSKNGAVVCSLFDGMSVGRQSLKDASIPVGRYIASEIDKHAMKVANSNHNDIEQVGCVTRMSGKGLPDIDLLMGGSPCQGFSFSGKMLNFDDPRSKLFFDYVRLKNTFNPRYFLLENVVMKQDYQDVISEHMGCEPVMINSSLVSAQNRKRLYWTNIPFEQPEDTGINLIDILESTPDDMVYPAAIRGRRVEKMENKATIVGRRINSKGLRADYDLSIPVVQCLEVRKVNRNKSNCLTTVQKDNVLTNMPVGRHVDVYGKKLPYRNYTVTECERLQTLPDGYTSAVSPTQARKMIGNGWNLNTITHILKGMTL